MLTDQEIIRIRKETPAGPADVPWSDSIAFARAVLAAVRAKSAPNGSAPKPVALANLSDLVQVSGCNGVSVWCENPAIYDEDTRPPSSLVPLYDDAELWRVAARAAEVEQQKPQAKSDEREQLREAQTGAVMPLIGPLLDAWEWAKPSVRTHQPELAKQLTLINWAMLNGLTRTESEATASCMGLVGAKSGEHVQLARIGGPCALCGQPSADQQSPKEPTISPTNAKET